MGYVKKLYIDGLKRFNHFEIEFNDEKLHLSKKDIEELFEKLKSVGFDVKKLL